MTRHRRIWLGAGCALLAAGFTTPAFAQANPINTADTAWMIVATALVLMMTIPGLALFYSGMVRKKNVLATMAQSLAAVALISILWVAFGYSLVFRRRRALAWHPRPLVSYRHDHGQRQSGRKDDSGSALHALPDDLRDHHCRAGRRLRRRPHAIFSLSAVFDRLVHVRLRSARTLDLGRRLSRLGRRARFRWRPRGASQRRHRRAGGGEGGRADGMATARKICRRSICRSP